MKSEKLNKNEKLSSQVPSSKFVSSMIKVDGFKFAFDASKCEECGGKCCIGESGYIWVDKKEIKNIAKFLKIDVKDFIKKYLRKIDYKYSLKEIKVNSSYNCVFFENGKCTIYEVRPKQCKTFPFWDFFKEDYSYLLKECPGVIPMEDKK